MPGLESYEFVIAVFVIFAIKLCNQMHVGVEFATSLLHLELIFTFAICEEQDSRMPLVWFGWKEMQKLLP
jgi:hypothetical protein